MVISLQKKKKNITLKHLKKKHFEELLEIDFKKAHEQYKKNFFKKDHTTSEKELLIEMLFQLGAKGVSKFKKMLYFLKKKKKIYGITRDVRQLAVFANT